MSTLAAATSPRASGRAAPKLRDSCQACAASKVKCHKEKPKCSRCAKRGLVCEYHATKRAGRTSYKKQAADAAKRLSVSTQNVGAINDAILAAGLPHVSTDNWFTLNAFATANEVNPSTSRSFGSLNTTSEGSPTLFGDVGSIKGLSSSSLNELPKFDEYLDFAASPTAMSSTSTEPRLPDSNLFSVNNMDGMDICSDSSRSSYNLNRFTGFDEPYAGLPGDCFSVLDPCLSGSRSSSIAMAASSPQQACRSLASGDYPCSYTNCLPRALDILKQLAPPPTSPCRMSGGQLGAPNHDGTRKPPTIQTVIAQNRQTIDAVRSMLECPCSGDDVLTMVLTLIVCKVFGWYAAASRVSGPSRSNSVASSGSQSPVEQVAGEPVVVGNYCLDGEGSVYMAGQLVLSELHRVQRIVNQLSMRLTGRSGSPLSENSEMKNGCQFDAKSNEAFSMSLFSAPLLHQLERDLKKGLRKLSLDIVRELEREFVD